MDEDSALVEMFGQVGAYKCKYIVAVGALAGLSVSMFGSMFPMPRIIYAMAQDGLIFRYANPIQFNNENSRHPNLLGGLILEIEFLVFCLLQSIDLWP